MVFLVIVLYCKKIEFKDVKKKPILCIILKEDENYIYVKTRKGESRQSHDLIANIEDTNILFSNGDNNER